MIALDRTEEVAEFVARIAGKPFHPPFTAIGVANDAGALIGGFVFTGFNGDGIEVSVAGRGIARRSAWRAALAYVFDQLGCARMQMHTRKSNVAVRRILPRFGVKYEGTARRFYGNESGLIFSLTSDDLAGFRARWRL
jgi:RimJ/RimL family protein N-acetyltransferase